MTSARYKREECLRVLASAGADFGLVNLADQCVSLIVVSNQWTLSFQQAVLDVIRVWKIVRSSNVVVFSPFMFVALLGDIEALKSLIEQPDIRLDQDDNGFSIVMFATLEGHVEAFRLLVYAGADMKFCNKSSESAIALSELNQNCVLFEKVMLAFALENGNSGAGGFYVLPCAARCGDLATVRLLTGRGYDENVPNGDGYTSLMIAAWEGHGCLCELLISFWVQCDIKNARGEIALSLARKNGGFRNEAECVILYELARKLVLSGAQV
ncbi:hypothetical protein HHK36_014537 [Tetracentron sinense]|uniref:Ankyrin repeat protein n=1 Tax=Tetracentron sinense TaxID=13715 RepID=A0A834Z2T7_TETSI|nr:hypothetical protein HHK36_014537 [Tetracentron sinense]